MRKIVNLNEIEKIVGYKFKNKNLLQTAFIHSSYSNEHHIDSNERLEFLGDAVIEFIITEKLFREFKGKEGDLSKIRSNIVSEKPLAEAIDRLNLEQFLKKGVGESRNTTHSNRMKCDLFEAICGAIYMDSGLDETIKFFDKAVGNIVEQFKLFGYEDDPKTKLQEMLKQSKIVYSTTKTGEDHLPTYITTVFINDEKMGKGKGSNKKMAEENAAKEAINNIGK